MVRPDVPWFDQGEHRLRFGWGPNGLRQLAPAAAVVVIVDVLSFSTSVDLAVDRGAIILPYRWHDGSEEAYAEDHGAILARRRNADGVLPAGYSLRPSSLTTIEAGVRLVLPSPNGSALTFGAAETAADGRSGDARGRQVLVGCLRNAGAVGAAAARLAGSPESAVAAGPTARAGVVEAGGAVAVIAAGERWKGTTGPLRPALEDLLGAGAILSAAAEALGSDHLSPEAWAAVAAFRDAAGAGLPGRLRACGSGRELIDKGFPADVELAADLDASAAVPALAGVELVDRRH